jgi:hypothetical protein
VNRATLPFEPTYELVATFHAVTGADGRPVVSSIRPSPSTETS